EPAKLKSAADWIEAGQRVFFEADDLHLRTSDPTLIAAARQRETFDAVGAQPLADGTVYGLRWAPTRRGLALTLTNCSGCHLLYLSTDMAVRGPPSLAPVVRDRDSRHRVPLIEPLHAANHVVTGAAPFVMGGGPVGGWLSPGTTTGAIRGH